MSNSKPKILWVSDSPEMLQVGQSRVGREICYRLHDLGYPIEVAGYIPDKDKLRSNPIDAFKVYCTERYKTLELIEIIRQSDPDVIILSHDYFMFNGVKDIRKEFGSKHKIIGYFTIDGEPVPHIFREVFYKCDHVVVPSEYGKRVVAERFFNVPLSVIPYGVNTSLYNYEGKEKIKDDFANAININLEQIQIKDKLIYFYVGNNQGRKNVGAARDGFKRFADKHPGEVLFIVILKNAVCSHGDISYIGYFDPYEFNHPDIRIISTHVNDDVVSKFYKISDFLLHPTNGEGFGLTILEAMASKCIPIVPNYSAHTDFCTPMTSILINNWTKMIGEFEVIRAQVDDDHILTALESSYHMAKDIKESKQKACVEVAKMYSWDESAKKFGELVDKLVLDKYADEQLRVKRI